MICKYPPVALRGILFAYAEGSLCTTNRAMSILATLHLQTATALAPLASYVFLPLAIAQTTFQSIHFQVLNWFSYARLILIYNYNLLHVLKETERDKQTFQTSYEQKRFNNTIRVRNNSRPVDPGQRHVFDVVDSWWDFPTLWSKARARSNYLYDRWIINFPATVLEGNVFQTGYVWCPTNGLFSNDSSNTAADGDISLEGLHVSGVQDQIGSAQINSSKPFIPKPYVIPNTERIKTAGNGASKGASTFATGCPVLPFADSLKIVPEDHTTVSATESNSRSVRGVAEAAANSISYKIKIRAKPKDYHDHPTYGNYNLLRQAIRNVIPQPGYQPDGTIGPNLVRFTWHCCGHYDRVTGTGGSSGGTMRFAQEFNDVGNTGLNTAKSYLDQVHQDFPWISFADLYTLGGVVAIEDMGGPIVAWRPGRTDCTDAARVPPNTRLPNATKDSNHIKEVFYDRLGFNAQETVALIGGGHSIGGCHARFSGFNGIWTKTPFTWDNSFFTVLLEEEWKLGIVPQTGIEQYYNSDKSLMMLNTDMEMMRCPDFRKWVEIFARDEAFFNEVFAQAFAKLLELGVLRDADGIQRVKL